MKSDFPAFYKIAQRTLNATVVCIMGWFNVAWGESRNLFVYDDSLTSFTWNTRNECFVDETGTSVAFSTGDNVSFSFSEDATIWLSEDIHVGTLNLNSSGLLSIYTGSYALNADRIELSGLVTMDSALHIDAGTSLAISDGAHLDAPLVLGENGELIVNGTARLSSTTLTLQGGARLSLPIMGNERVHTLFKGISMVLDAEGNDLFMSTSSISAAEYFDVSYPGAEFWVDATLQFTHGTLQLVRQNDWYKAAEVVTSRQTAPVEYRNYTRVVYEQIESGSESQGVFGYGGALYCPDTKTCVFSDNGSIIFKANSSVSEGPLKGGVIYVGLDSRIEFSGNGRVEFSNNSASGAMADGGAVYLAQGSEIVLENNDGVIFSENQVSGYGGAVFGYNCDIVLAMNDIVEFCKNSAISEVHHCMGGAIYAGGDGAIRLENNGRVTFDENRCSSRYNAIGGAIHGEGGIWLSKNDSVSFTANCSGEDGGAISTFGELYINNNGSVAFNENVSGYDGGAIRGQTVELCDNQSVTFDKNSASGEFNNGGGVSAYEVLVIDNRSVIFIDNYAGGEGGGISSAPPNSQIQELIFFHNNDSIIFSGNIAGDSGGAIQSDIVTMTGNGSIEFIKNAALGSTGGAIDASNVSETAHSITVCDNDMVVFRGNTASYNGGAIVVSDQLIICNNDSILFEKNAEIYGGNYHLKSVHVDGGSHVSFSAPESKCFEFRDSLYIGADSLVKYNEVFVKAEGDAIHQTGDIIFTGKYTELHLNEILEAAGAGRTASDEEVLNSRTTEVYAMTNLYGGRLRVEDGAIYQGQGITVHKDSAATVRVKDAVLSHGGYVLEFNAGTALEVAGNSTIRGNVNLLADSLFKLEQAATLSLYETLQADAATLTVKGSAMLEGASTLNASLTLADGATLDMMSLDAGAVTINGALTLGGQVKMGEHLLAAVEELTCYDPGLVLFTGLTNLVLPVAASELESDRVLASSVFSNVENPDLYVTYHVVDNVGSLMVMSVPEPTTTSLSLAALVALAMRRRRR